MTEPRHVIFRRLLAGMLCLDMVAPASALANSGSEGYMDYLGTDAVIITILISNSILLLGFLFRLQQMRKNISQKTTALEKNEKHMRMMGDKLPNITLFQLESSPEGGFVFRYISEGFKQVMGFERERVMHNAKLAFDHVYEDDIPALRATYRVAQETLQPTDLKIRVLDISGNLKWLHISAVPHWENELLVWDGMMQDISDTKHIEDALLEEKHNLQNLFETIDDFMLVCDMKGNLLHSNPSVEQRLEYSRKELSAMSLVELYPEHLHTEVYQIIALMQSERSTLCGLPLEMKSGGTIQVEMNLFQGSWKNRKAILGIARDTTHRRQTETALRESQQMLQLIMDTIPMSVFWKNKGSIYLGCNKAFIKECGFGDVDDVVGKTPYELFDQDTAEDMINRDLQVVAANQPQFNILLPYTLNDGTVGQREASKIPLHNEEAQAVGVLELWRDVTEENMAKERLKRTLEDMERFNQLMRGRERRTLELKAEINHLHQELGRQIKYKSSSDELT